MPEIIGLVLAGGNSRRMGKDKSMLKWKGQPWLKNQVTLMQSVCEKVYISCQKEQISEYQKFASCIEDEYLVGPLGGILSSMQHLKSSLLVVPNDMLTLTAEDLNPLIAACDDKRDGVFYIHDQIKDIAPFPGLYNLQSMDKIKQAVESNNLRVRSLLLTLNAALIQPPDISRIGNWNSKKDISEVND